VLAIEVALVSEAPTVTHAEVACVAAALQKQAIRDFGDVWGIVSTIDGFATLEDVPVGYWPIIVLDDIGGGSGVAGYHHDDDGQPFSLVRNSANWSLTASHEMLEMLVDPWGNRLIAGQSPKRDQGEVEFLVEVADPPQATDFGYTVNGRLVSDFITPDFYSPVAASGVRYSFGGNIAGPRQIAQGGYVSWHDPITDHWWQQTWFDAAGSRFVDLGLLTGVVGSLRAAIDERTRPAISAAGAEAKASRRTSPPPLTSSLSKATDRRADNWRAQIARLSEDKVTMGRWSEGSSSE
jgi:hypothetical protein